MRTSIKILMAFAAIWITLSLISVAQSQESFPEDKIIREISAKWSTGGFEEATDIWIAANTNYRPSGSLKVDHKDTHKTAALSGLKAPKKSVTRKSPPDKTWHAFAIQEFSGSVPNIGFGGN